MRKTFLYPLIALGTALGLWLFLLSPPGQYLARQFVIGRLAESSGGRAELGQLHTNFFSRLEMGDLAVELADGGGFAIKHLVLRYSLWNVWWNDAPPVYAEVEDLQIIRAPATDVLPRAALRRPLVGPLPAELLAVLPDTLRLTSLKIADNGEEALHLDGTLECIAVRSADAALDLSVRGIDLRPGRATARLAPLALSGQLAVDTARVQVNKLNVVGDDLALDLSGTYTGTALDLRLGLQGDLAALTPLVESADPAGALTAAAALTWTDTGVDASARVNLRDPQWRAYHLDAAALRLSYNDEGLHLDTLSVQVDTGHIAGRGRVHLDTAAYIAQLDLDITNLDATAIAGFIAAPSWQPTGRLSGTVALNGPLASAQLQRAYVDLRAAPLKLGAANLGRTRIQLDYADTLLKADLDSRAGRLRVAGALQPDGRHDLRWRLDALDLARFNAWTGAAQLSGRVAARATSKGDLRHPEVEIDATFTRPRLAALQMARLTARVQLDSLGRAQLHLRDPQGDFQLDLRADSLAVNLRELRLGVRRMPLSDYLEPATARLWDGFIDAEVSLVDTSGQPQIRGTAQIADLTYADQLLGDARVDLTLVEGLGVVGITALNESAALATTFQLEGDIPFAVEGHLRRLDLAPFLIIAAGGRDHAYGGRLSAALTGQGSFKQYDRMRLNVDVHEVQLHSDLGVLRSASAAHFHLEDRRLDLDSLQLGGSAGRLRLAGRVTAADSLELELALADLRLAALWPFISRGDAHLDGRLNGNFSLAGTAALPQARGRATVADLHFAGAELGTLHADLVYADHHLRTQRADLQLPRGRMRLEGHIGLDAQSPRRGVDLRLVLEDVEFTEAQGLPAAVTARLAGTAALRGPDLDPAHLQTRAMLSHLELDAGRFRLAGEDSVALHLDRAGGLALEGLQLRVWDLEHLEADVGYLSASGRSLDPDGLQLTMRGLETGALVGLAARTWPVGGRLDADLILRGPLQQAEIALEWRLTEARYEALVVPAFAGTATFAQDVWHLDEAELTIGNGRIAAAAVLPVSLDGTWDSTAELNAELRIDAVDLDALAPLYADIEKLAGRCDAHLELAGTPDSLHPTGFLALVDGAVKMRNLNPTFAFARGQVLVDGNEFRLEGFNGRTFGGDWALSGGVLLRGARPDSFDVALELNNLELEIPQTLKLATQGRLEWQGSADTSRVSGQLHLPQGAIVEPIDLQGLAADKATRPPASAAAPWTHKVALDVDLTTGALEVENELMDVAMQGALQLAGTAAAPTLNGEVSAVGSVVYLGQAFELERAVLALDGSQPLANVYTLLYDPALLDPDLDVLAHGDLKAKNGNEYRITAAVHGPLSTFAFDLTSDPPRNQVEILSLLSFGRPDVMMMDAQGLLLDQRSRRILSPKYLMGSAQARFQRVLGVDDLSIDKSVFKSGDIAGARITITKQISERAEMTYSTQVGYAAKGRVQLNYKLTKGVTLQTERDAEGESGMDLKLKLKFR